jgi:hypothetical protein
MAVGLADGLSKSVRLESLTYAMHAYLIVHSLLQKPEGCPRRCNTLK